MPPAMGTDDATEQSKSALRSAMKDRRAALSAEERSVRARAAAALAAREITDCKTALLYSAVSTEIDCAPLHDLLQASGVRLAYPRVSGRGLPLKFAVAGDRAELVPGYAGILEPPPYLEEISAADIDVFVVPGLAFDPEGNRLGWGQGHYDLTLAANPQALRIGLCFQEQITPSVPHETTDQPMDRVVTDQKCYSGPARRAHGQSETK